MKKTRLILVLSILAILLTFSLTKNSYAQWSAINSGYAVTTNWHGQEVPLGQSVTAWAGTTNSSVYQIKFVWKNQSGIIFSQIVTEIVSYTTPDYPPGAPQEIIQWASNNAGITIYYANNTQIPNSLGEWSVQVFFYAPGGNLCGNASDIIKIRATSFNTVPTAPIVGTAGLTVTMLLGFYLFRRLKSPSSFSKE